MVSTNAMKKQSIALLLLGTVIADVGVAMEPLLPLVPEVVGEERWDFPLGKEVQHGEVRPAQRSGVRGLEWHYEFPAGRSAPAMTWPFPASHPVAERMGLFFRGDGSGHILRVSCYFEETERWHRLADVPLDHASWQYLEIFAGNPLHKFHKGVTAFRFEVVRGPDAQAEEGILAFANPQLISPTLLDLPLQPSHAPSPMFNTWGGAALPQIQVAAEVGVGMHMVPISFFSRPVEQRVEAAVRRLPEIHRLGMMPGLAFYNHPGRDWLEANPELGVQTHEGRIYDGGGAYTSLWNPEARRLWREHIQASLKELKRQDILPLARMVMINPGEEGEVSYAWSDIWAHDPYAKQAWRDYLERKYTTVQAMNADFRSAYRSFDDVEPPIAPHPDREHAVFADFYRLSMLRYCVEMADAVRTVWEPDYWLWMTHTVGPPDRRYYSARYPLFYIEQLQRLGLMDYAHIAVLGWQTRADVDLMRSLGARIIGETDVVMRLDRLLWTFDQSEHFGTDGVFIGAAEALATPAGEITDVGQASVERISAFKHPVPPK